MLVAMEQADLLRAAHELLVENGASGPIRWLHDSREEWVFILCTRGAAGMHEANVTRALMGLLKAKVAIATDGPGWGGKGAPL